MPEPKKKENCEKDEDEVTIARSIVDELIAETEKEEDDKDRERPIDLALEK